MNEDKINSFGTILIVLFFIVGVFIVVILYLPTNSVEQPKLQNEIDTLSEQLSQIQYKLLTLEKSISEFTQVTQNNITTINKYTNVYDTFHERQKSNYCVGSYYIDWDYTVSGQSMLPTIGHGDIAKGVKYTSRKDLVPGDIITYTTPEYGDYIHRVVAVYDTYLLAQGDNNEYQDEWRIEYDWVKHVICEIQFT